jgi:phage/plasmid-associated DNA primase
LTEGRSIDITALKQIMDVGLITARHVFQRNITFRASHSLFTTTNYIPTISEVDHGTWRRLALLRFPYTFRKLGEPLDGATDKRGDPTLKERIRGNLDGQHDAAVTWAIDGAIRYYSESGSSGLTEKIKDDTREWRTEADRILGFWNAWLIPDLGACIMTREMCQIFNDWLVSNGHSKWAAETFAPRFLQHAETIKHRVIKIREQNPEGLSRRKWSLDQGDPPEKPWVYRGVRWRGDNEA